MGGWWLVVVVGGLKGNFSVSFGPKWLWIWTEQLSLMMSPILSTPPCNSPSPHTARGSKETAGQGHGQGYWNRCQLTGPRPIMAALLGGHQKAEQLPERDSGHVEAEQCLL